MFRCLTGGVSHLYVNIALNTIGIYRVRYRFSQAHVTVVALRGAFTTPSTIDVSYLSRCFATLEINTKILSWAHKQFVTPVYALFNMWYMLTQHSNIQYSKYKIYLIFSIVYPNRIHLLRYLSQIRPFPVFSWDQAARGTFCLAISPSVTLFCTMFLSSYPLVPLKNMMSMETVNVRGQRSRSQRSKQILPKFGCFRTVTQVWIHRWLQNDAQSLK